jgi:hypothetical protein
MDATVIEITNPNQLPREKLRMESAPTLDTAKAWADKIGRTVYWLSKNKTAYAPMAVEQ